MTAVAVEISPRRPFPSDGPGAGEPYFTRPVLAAAPPVTRITGIADMDTVMDSAKCSCAAGDDNPH
ncbi:hypothetical protein [Streptomyces sp. GC420]|uniref:hypothetical protein n=1 Tax=Streptomyces sp. GC420 TaxID=2697568 RepID=UPI0014152D1C|nr:hypothetical protein [Streptomyces sp. GC420]NBM15778.1 hypothetical protein [Streptomyces sp. GC420]